MRLSALSKQHKINNFLHYNILNNMRLIRKNIWVIIIGFIIIGFVIITISLTSVRATDHDMQSISQKIVKTSIVEPKRFAVSEEYAGFVRGTDQAVITTKITGRVTNILKKEGDTVKKGEVIAYIDADEIVAQSQSAQQTINALQKNLTDTKKYYSQKVDEAKDNDATKEEVKSAKRLRDLQMQSVQVEIVSAQGAQRVAQSYAQETTIRAPFDGVVTRVFQEIGQVVSPATPICEVANQSELSVEIFVSDDAVPFIAKEDLVTVFCGNDHTKCQGKIMAISPVSEMNAHKSLVRVQFSKDDPLIHLGQYVTINLPITDDVSDRIIVPEQSIIAKYDEKFVFILIEGVAVERKVSIGHVQSGMVEIIAGLESGDELIIEGVYGLRNNDAVTLYE